MNSKRLALASATALLLAAPAAFAQWHHPYGWARPYARFYFGYAPRIYPYVYAPAYVAAPPAPYAYRRYYVPQPAVVPEAYGQRQYSEVAHEPDVSLARIEPPVAPRIERTVLSARELFAFDEATVQGPVPKLDEIAETMKRERGIDRVRITGFTDRIGTKEYNEQLSERRAEAVKQYLVSKGVEPGRLVAEGKGMSNPLVACSDEDRAELIKCLEPNRRVEVEQIVIERRVPQA